MDCHAMRLLDVPEQSPLHGYSVKNVIQQLQSTVIAHFKADTIKCNQSSYHNRCKNWQLYCTYEQELLPQIDKDTLGIDLWKYIAAREVTGPDARFPEGPFHVSVLN